MELVSVIIPTYHGENNLKRAIQSVLSQTWDAIEVLVVDDNDPNDLHRKLTQAVMQEYQSDIRVYYIQHDTNRGGSAARNTGMKNAKGTYISFLDDDDIYLPKRIETCVSILKQHAEYEGVLTSVLHVKGDYFERIVKIEEKEDMKRELLLNMSLLGSGSNIFITKKAVDALGGFDERFRRHQDLEYMIRFYRSYRTFCCPDILCVKYTDRTENIPEYNNFYKIKKLFIEVFSTDIESLNQEDIELFYLHQYEQLFNIAIYEKGAKNIDKARKDLENYRKLSKKEKIKFFMAKIKIKNFSLLSFSYKLRLLYKKSILCTGKNKNISSEIADYINSNL